MPATLDISCTQVTATELESEDTPEEFPTVAECMLPSPQAPTKYQDSATVLQILDRQDPLAAASSMAEHIGETYFALGGVLSHIKRCELHVQAGYHGRTGFRDYCEKSLGYSHRKAQHLIDVYETVCRLELDVDRLREIGWAKAKELVKVARVTDGPELLKKDFEALVAFAVEHKHDELVRHIRQKYLDPARSSWDNQIRSATFRFKLFGDAVSNVEEAFEKAKAEAGSENPNKVFEHIVCEWSILSRGISRRDLHPPKTPEQLIEFGRQVLGVEVQIVGHVGEPASSAEPDDLGQEVTEAATGSAEAIVYKKPRVRTREDLLN